SNFFVIPAKAGPIRRSRCETANASTFGAGELSTSQEALGDYGSPLSRRRRPPWMACAAQIRSPPVDHEHRPDRVRHRRLHLEAGEFCARPRQRTEKLLAQAEASRLEHSVR